MLAIVVLAVSSAAGLPSATAQDTVYTQIERGRYTLITGNCQGCHTAPGEEPFAGGRGLETAVRHDLHAQHHFRPRYWPWQMVARRFLACHARGHRAGRLAPLSGFPFPHFSKMPREEVDALYDYLATLPRVKKQKPENELPWPLSWRFSLAGWRLLFFEPEPFQPDPNKSQEWNRGAYLVEGPGHCAGCHTEKNLAGADKESRHLAGRTTGELGRARHPRRARTAGWRTGARTTSSSS
ncbi:MAG: cytochrome c [Chitinophagaceae bacterium]|nr:cytochrome c [Chitinophagaceae bacterium]